MRGAESGSCLCGTPYHPAGLEVESEEESRGLDVRLFGARGGVVRPGVVTIWGRGGVTRPFGWRVIASGRIPFGGCRYCDRPGRVGR